MDKITFIINGEGLAGHPDAELLATFFRGAYPVVDEAALEKFITMLGVLCPTVNTRTLLQEHCPSTLSVSPTYQRAANSVLSYLRRMLSK